MKINKLFTTIQNYSLVSLTTTGAAASGSAPAQALRGRTRAKTTPRFAQGWKTVVLAFQCTRRDNALELLLYFMHLSNSVRHAHALSRSEERRKTASSRPFVLRRLVKESTHAEYDTQVDI